MDRKSLETIYLTFIRPLLEYGDIIWDNCTQQEKTELDKIQNEAARIATGATKLVSVDALYKEIGWETLEQRRNNHKLTLFFTKWWTLLLFYISRPWFRNLSVTFLAIIFVTLMTFSLLMLEQNNTITLFYHLP